MTIDDRGVPAGRAVIILGGDEPCGVYLLRLEVESDLALRFGRFRGGSAAPVSSGTLLYVGSAMARSGSMTLARRLLRHASRSSAPHPHLIRAQMCETFVTSGLIDETVRPPREKKLFWNIDYLLDDARVELVQVFLQRTQLRLEDEVAALIAGDPASAMVAPGLGAHDRPGQTHLFYIRADAGWWERLAGRIGKLASANASPNHI